MLILFACLCLLALAAPVLIAPALTVQVAPRAAAADPVPSNDLFADATDLSAGALPGPGEQPLQISGSTVNATREDGEPDDEASGNGTVWYRFTSPDSGFSGRLGLRVTDAAEGQVGPFTVRWLAAADPGDSNPSVTELRSAPSNAYPPNNDRYVWMEPGQTVWFQISRSRDNDDDGDFVLELFEAENYQDDLAHAFDWTFGKPLGSAPAGDHREHVTDGDTFNLTADPAVRGANMWFALPVEADGLLDLEVSSLSASGVPTGRPLSFALFRAVHVPATDAERDLASPPLAEAVSKPQDPPVLSLLNPEGLSGHVAAMDRIAVAPGTYYLSVEAPPQESPTFFLARYTFNAGQGSGPGNDDFADAVDMSDATIPAYRPDNAGQPLDTVSFEADTTDATWEDEEREAIDAYPGSNAHPDGGTLWYRFTSPADGFAGRLGYRLDADVPDALGLAVFSPDPTGEPSDVDFQDLNLVHSQAWPPRYLDFLQMEPGHTVYIAVYPRASGADFSDSTFSLHLFQAPNEQDLIANAFDISYGGWGSAPTGWSLDGDTFHLSQDRADRPANGWFTTTVERAGTIEICMVSGTANPPVTSDRPLSLALFRAPSMSPVTDPDDLGDPIHALTSGPGDPACSNADPLPKQAIRFAGALDPGRYYWSFEQPAGADPTFFRSFGTFTPASVVQPPDTTAPILTISGAPIGTTDLAHAELLLTADEPSMFVCTIRSPNTGGTDEDLACGADSPATSSPVVIKDLGDGDVKFTARARDDAGNISEDVSVEWSVQAPPVATILTPSDGASYGADDLPELAYTCTDNSGQISAERVTVDGQTLLGSALPNGVGQHELTLLCVDAAGIEGTDEIGYTVVPSSGVDVTTKGIADYDPVLGSCYRLADGSASTADPLACDAASGEGADGLADGLTRFRHVAPGRYTLVSVSQPADPAPGTVVGRTHPRPQSVDVHPDEVTAVSTWTFACTIRCAVINHRLGDGSPTPFPVWPMNQAENYVEPPPVVDPSAAEPDYRRAFVVDRISYARRSDRTEVTVVADDFGRAPIEVGHVSTRFTDTVTEYDLTLTTLHTLTVLLQGPGLDARTMPTCVQLRLAGSAASRRTGCAPPGVDRIGFRALPGRYLLAADPNQPLDPAVIMRPTSVTVTDTVASQSLDVPMTIDPRARVEVDLVPSPAPTAPLGGEVTWAATVRNVGPVSAPDTVVHLDLPEGLEYLGVTAPGSIACSEPAPGDSTLSCSLGVLPAATEMALQVRTRIRASGEAEVRAAVLSPDCWDADAGTAGTLCGRASAVVSVEPTDTVSVATPAGDLVLRLSVGRFTRFEGVDPSKVPPPPSGWEFPYGVLAFTISDVPRGGRVTLTLSGPADVSRYWKVVAGAWVAFDSDNPDPRTLVIDLVDGGAGDADGVANGVITDPGAPARQISAGTDPPPGNGGTGPTDPTGGDSIADTGADVAAILGVSLLLMTTGALVLVVRRRGWGG